MLVIFIKKHIEKKKKIEAYNNSMFFKEMNIPYKQMSKQKNLMGIYLAYDKLKGYTQYNTKFLFNCKTYPNNRLKRVDMIMFHPMGIFVFKVLDYEGKVTGSSDGKKWTQPFKKHKKRFKNPVMDTNASINWMRVQFQLNEKIPMYSVIAFNSNAYLKKIQKKDEHCIIANIEDLDKAILEVVNKKNKTNLNNSFLSVYDEMCLFTKI
jgi:hypothetical protein